MSATPRPIVHLHNHTSWSVRDGLQRLKPMVAAAKADGQPAIAVTDHGSLGASWKLSEIARKSEVKAILGCLLAGQEIVTADGVKPVEEVQFGDRVLTHRGRFMPVTSTMERRHDGLAYKVRLAGRYPRELVLTEDHPILVRSRDGSKEWIKPGEIEAGRHSKHGGRYDWNAWVCLPKLREAVTELDLAVALPPEFLVQERTVQRTYASKFRCPTTWNIGRYQPLDHNFGYLLGLYTAEGSLGKKKGGLSGEVVLSVHADEVATFITHLDPILERFATTAYSCADKRSEGASIHFSCSPLAELLAGLVGEKAVSKRVPECVLTGPASVRRGFIEGLLDGDGKTAEALSNPFRRRDLKVVSPHLAWGLHTLLADLGHWSTITSRPGSCFGGSGNGSTTYTVYYSPERGFSRTIADDEFVYRPISEVIPFHLDAQVFNFEVTEDHSYVSDFVLHNCEVYLAFGNRRERNTIEGVQMDADSDSDNGGEQRARVKKYQHLTVLAESPKGWENLLVVSNEAHDPDAFWSKPRVDMDLLAKHREGLIVLTGCVGGPVAGRLIAGDDEGARANLATMVELWGQGSVFVEVMDHGIEAERKILPDLVRLAREFGLRTVATNDAHFTHAHEDRAHEALLCLAQDDVTLSTPDRWRFQGAGYHLRTAAEMRALFDDQPGTEGALDTTLLIAERVADRVIREPKIRLPKFGLPEGTTADHALFLAVRDGARKLYGDPLPEVVKQRLRHEMSVIKEKGLSDYFLIVQDMIQWARSQGIRVGPGRGSAAGCCIAYCLGIIAIDPIAHGLLFERFLSPDRVGMPDIDTDFEILRRELVLSYLTERYGADRTARIGTYGQSMTNASLRNAGRVLDYPSLGAKLASKVPNGAGGKPVPLASLEDPNNPLGAEFRSTVEQESEAEAILEIARVFEGNVSSEGIHACGFVISDEPLPGLVPLRRDRRKGKSGRDLVTEWDGKDVDDFGMMKLDILGIRNLDAIAATERIVKERFGLDIDAESASDDINDPDPVAAERARSAWALIAAGKTAGLFQLESSGMTELAQKIAPTNLDELSAIIALFRPGPLGMGMHERYAERKAGREPIDYGIFSDSPEEVELIAGVLGNTYGVPCYQEQLMQLSQVVAGFDAVGRDRLRKAVGKKIREEMDAVGEMFLKGAVSDVDSEGHPKLAFKRATAVELWKAMSSAGEYAFNKSHSLGYGKLAYETAYLKANWPAAFGAGLLSVTEQEERRVPILRALAKDEIRVDTPDVNVGDVTTTLDPSGTIRIGMGEVKGMGHHDAAAIVAERKANGPFESLADLVTRVRVAPAPAETDEDGSPEIHLVPPTTEPQAISLGTVKALIEAGACDTFGSRAGQMRVLRTLRDYPDTVVPDTEWGGIERSARERSRLGVAISANPLAELSPQVKSWRSPARGSKPTTLHAIESGLAGEFVSTIGVVARWEVAKKGRRRAYLTLEGSKASLDCIVWPNVLGALEAGDRVPMLGDIIGVDARVRTTRVVARRDSDFYDAEFSDDVPEDQTKIELTVNDVWRGQLHDLARGVLTPVVIPPRPVPGQPSMEIGAVKTPAAPAPKPAALKRSEPAALQMALVPQAPAEEVVDGVDLSDFPVWTPLWYQPAD